MHQKKQKVAYSCRAEESDEISFASPMGGGFGMKVEDTKGVVELLQSQITPTQVSSRRSKVASRFFDTMG